MILLQHFGALTGEELIHIFVVLVVAIAIGTYVGTLLALQKFFGELSWEDISMPDQD